ncbi:hypothetical protein FHC48_22485 [Enterobacter sp. EC_50]|uniref:cytidylyltransferase domain-containing protein n=1 Tax=Enterobacter sp. EC_50 TaxID=2584088 RepID=UPI001C700C8F|nr:hypothetical protein [Enterobacter sp. EC_50]MBW9446429.1 hypothetical protein [Enterobacter sp. EC_50]
MTKTVAFVPLKLNNERLPGKNTKSFSDGVPLVSCILQTLKQVSNIDEIVVYCSDDAIINFLPEGIRFIKRSTSLDLATTKINEVLTSFAHQGKFMNMPVFTGFVV